MEYDIYAIVDELKDDISASGLKLAAVCREAKVVDTIFRRWVQREVEPKSSKVKKVREAFDRLRKRKTREEEGHA
jgi:hypothetical protein